MQFDSKEKQRCSECYIQSKKGILQQNRKSVLAACVHKKKRVVRPLQQTTVKFCHVFCIMTLYYDRPKDDTVRKLARVRNVNECVKKKEKVILFLILLVSVCQGFLFAS